MAQSGKPNILYIMTDQQRRDSVSGYGRSICMTPHLDQLAAEGMRFDNAYTVCGLCSPARTSMLTGLYPHNHRMWNNNDMFQRATRDLPDEVRLISEDLAAAGYACGYSGKWHCGHDKVPSTYGFEGMDVPDYGTPYSTEEYDRYVTARGLSTPKTVQRVGGDEQQVGAAGTLDGPVEACAPHFVAEFAIDLMQKLNEERKATGSPFMMFVSFWAPHHPCLIPEPYASMYDPADVVLWPNFRDELLKKPRSHERFRRSFCGAGADQSEDIWRQLIATYWGFCSFADAEIGRILSALEEMGRADDTAVFFSTDHGDMTGSHGGFWDKGPFMYEEVYHIPLIVRWPGVTRPGSVCSKLASNMDLATTALDVAGLPLPECHDGRSLAPLLRDPDADWRDDLMCEFHGHRYLYSQRMVRWDRYKFVFNPSDCDELYDLDADPHELNNVADDPQYAEIADRMGKALRAWQLEIHDSGLLPEEERAKRAADNGVMIYDMVRDPKLYDLPAYLDAAHVALANDPKNIQRLARLLEHHDCGVRYWGAVGCMMLGDTAASLTGEMRKMLNDESHSVRAIAAWHLIRIGEKETGLDCLKDLLEGNTYAAMKTLNVVYFIGEDGKPLVSAVKLFKPTGSYAKQKQGVVLSSLKAFK